MKSGFKSILAGLAAAYQLKLKHLEYWYNLVLAREELIKQKTIIAAHEEREEAEEKRMASTAEPPPTVIAAEAAAELSASLPAAAGTDPNNAAREDSKMKTTSDAKKEEPPPPPPPPPPPEKPAPTAEEIKKLEIEAEKAVIKAVAAVIDGAAPSPTSNQKEELIQKEMEKMVEEARQGSYIPVDAIKSIVNGPPEEAETKITAAGRIMRQMMGIDPPDLRLFPGGKVSFEPIKRDPTATNSSPNSAGETTINPNTAFVSMHQEMREAEIKAKIGAMIKSAHEGEELPKSDTEIAETEKAVAAVAKAMATIPTAPPTADEQKEMEKMVKEAGEESHIPEAAIKSILNSSPSEASIKIAAAARLLRQMMGLDPADPKIFPAKTISTPNNSSSLTKEAEIREAAIQAKMKEIIENAKKEGYNPEEASRVGEDETVEESAIKAAAAGRIMRQVLGIDPLTSPELRELMYPQSPEEKVSPEPTRKPVPAANAPSPTPKPNYGPASPPTPAARAKPKTAPTPASTQNNPATSAKKKWNGREMDDPEQYAAFNKVLEARLEARARLQAAITRLQNDPLPPANAQQSYIDTGIRVTAVGKVSPDPYLRNATELSPATSPEATQLIARETERAALEDPNRPTVVLGPTPGPRSTSDEDENPNEDNGDENPKAVLMPSRK